MSRNGGAPILLRTGAGAPTPLQTDGWFMKVDLYDAPLSVAAERLLKDSRAVHELIIEIMEGGERRRFEVKSGSQTLDVTAGEAVVATSGT